MAACKKGIVIRAFATDPGFLGGVSFLRTVDDYGNIFRRARLAGFTGVQPYLSLDDGVLSLRTTESALHRIRSLAADEGIDLPSLEIAPLEYSLTADAPEVRARGIEVVLRSLQVAAEIGAPAVLVIPGYVGKMWDPSTDQVDYADAWDRTLSCLREIAPAAEKLGVAVLLEPIWNMFLLSPLEMRAMVDQVGSSACGVLLDTGNVTLFGFAEQWIRILRDRVRQIHLKDFRRQVGNINGFVPLLAGDVNWPAVARAARDVGFAGYWIAEQFPFASHGDSILEMTSAAMDRILSDVGDAAREAHSR